MSRALVGGAEASAAALPNVVRLLPLQATCAATLDGLEEAIPRLLAQSMPEGAQSFAVHWKSRRRSGYPPVPLDRSDAISTILQCVDRRVQSPTVDLTSPDVTIHVEVLHEARICCLGVLPRWVERAEYSLVRAPHKARE